MEVNEKLKEKFNSKQRLDYINRYFAKKMPEGIENVKVPEMIEKGSLTYSINDLFVEETYDNNNLMMVEIENSPDKWTKYIDIYTYDEDGDIVDTYSWER